MTASTSAPASSAIMVEIDGRRIVTERGRLLIDVADEAGIHIPRFCYHPALSVAANCRMCLVEVERAPKPMPACSTPVADGMRVWTQSPLARAAQKSTMEFLLINHPLDCPVCDQGGECELQDVSMGFGGDRSFYSDQKRAVPHLELGDFVATDMTRCIHCTRCVRFSDELGGGAELGGMGRGESLEISTYLSRSLESPVIANITDLCPVGALTSKPFRFKARSWELTERPAFAPHDVLASPVWINEDRGEPVRVLPRRLDIHAPHTPGAWLADRDRFAYLEVVGAVSGWYRVPGQPLRRLDNAAVLQDSMRAVLGAGRFHRPVFSAASRLEDVLWLAGELCAVGAQASGDLMLHSGAAVWSQSRGQDFHFRRSAGAAVTVSAGVLRDVPVLVVLLAKAIRRGHRVWVLDYEDAGQIIPRDAVRTTRELLRAELTQAGVSVVDYLDYADAPEPIWPSTATVVTHAFPRLNSEGEDITPSRDVVHLWLGSDPVLTRGGVHLVLGPEPAPGSMSADAEVLWLPVFPAYLHPSTAISVEGRWHRSGESSTDRQGLGGDAVVQLRRLLLRDQKVGRGKSTLVFGEDTLAAGLRAARACGELGRGR